MTPTRAQYDAVLTHSSAGVRAATGDMDDPEDRAAMLDWLENLNRQAMLVGAAEPFRFSDNGFMALSDRILRTKRGGEPVEITKDELDLALRFDTGPLTKTEALDGAEDGTLTFYGRRVKLVDSHQDHDVSDEQGSDGTHGPREPEIATQRRIESKRDPVLDALLDEEEAIARGDRGRKVAIWNSSKHGRVMVELADEEVHGGNLPVLHNDHWKFVPAIQIAGFWEPLTKLPSKGKHESDLTHLRPRHMRRTDDIEEYIIARDWSRSA